MTVDNLERYRIVTNNNSVARRDSDNGSTHALQFDGNIVLEVTELESPETRIGVRFEDVCRLTAAGVEFLIGYVSLNTVVGDHDRGDGGDARDEGFYVLRIDVDEPARLPTATAGMSGLIAALREWRRRPITPADSARRFTPVLSRDPELSKGPRYAFPSPTFRAVGSRAVADLRGTRRLLDGISATATARLTLDAQPTARIPLAHGGTFVVNTGRSGSTVIRIPRLTLETTLVRGSALRSAADAQSANAFAAQVGSGVQSALLAPNVVRAYERILEVLPQYTAQRGDSGARAEDRAESPVAETLNEAIARGAAGDVVSVRGLFGNAQPFVISWNFSAVDAVSGNAIPVVRGAQAGPGAIRVQTSAGPFANTRLTAAFPRTGVYVLTATATLRDRDGITGQVSHVIRTHQLAQVADGDLEARIMAAAAAGANVSLDTLTADASLDEAAAPARRRAVRARVATNVAALAAADGIITVEELQQLVSAIRSYARPLR